MDKVKKCKYCKSEIDAKAKVCPTCKRTVKGHGCLITLLSVVIALGIIVAVILGIAGQNQAIQRDLSGVDSEDEYITLEEYNQIDSDMTYEEVVEIVGSEGTISSQVEANGIKIVIVTWYGNGVAGSNANVTFTNNSVTGKAQVGLK